MIVKELMQDLSNSKNEFIKTKKYVEDELTAKYNAVKVLIMCESLDIYIEFNEKNSDIECICDELGGYLYSTYLMEKKRVTYCISFSEIKNIF